MARLSQDARRRRTAAVRRVVAAYRTIRPELMVIDDIALLGRLAEELNRIESGVPITRQAR